MKRTFTSCLLGLVLLVSAVWSQANKTDGTEQAVTALEQQWLQSQKTNNADLLVPLLADNVHGARFIAAPANSHTAWEERLGILDLGSEVLVVQY